MIKDALIRRAAKGSPAKQLLKRNAAYMEAGSGEEPEGEQEENEDDEDEDEEEEEEEEEGEEALH